MVVELDRGRAHLIFPYGKMNVVKMQPSAGMAMILMSPHVTNLSPPPTHARTRARTHAHTHTHTHTHIHTFT
jgi:hypothetical protein